MLNIRVHRTHVSGTYVRVSLIAALSRCSALTYSRLSTKLAVGPEPPADLLAASNDATTRRMTSSFRRLKSPRSLTDDSRPIAPQLRMNGLFITYERSRGKRLFTVKVAICRTAGASHLNLCSINGYAKSAAHSKKVRHT